MRNRSFIAFLLVFLLLLAACTAGGTEESSLAEGESMVASDSSSSEETASEDASAETSRPEIPQTPVPEEESDTVLELLVSVPTASEGFYPYQVFMSEGTSMDALDTVPGVDAEGNLYICWRDQFAAYGAYPYRLFRLNDSVECELRDTEGQTESADGFYAFITENDDGTFTVSHVQWAEQLFFRPMIEVHCKLQKVPGGKYASQGEFSVFLPDIPGSGESDFFFDSEYVFRTGDLLIRETMRMGRVRTDETELGFVDQKETIYDTFDESGALRSQFLLYERSGFTTPCEMPYEYGAVQEYYASDLYLGDYTFERVFEHWVVYGSDGRPYLFLLYPDRCEAYRIHAGYHPEELSEASLNKEADFEDPTDKWGSPKLKLVQTITEDKLLRTPDEVCADENGKIYLLYASGDIYCLQDGTHYTFTYPYTMNRRVPEMFCRGGVLYLSFKGSWSQEDDVLYTVDLRTDGAESVLFPFPAAESEYSSKYFLFANQKQGVLLYLMEYDPSYSVVDERRTFFTMDGKALPKDEEPFFFTYSEGGGYRVNYGGKTIPMRKMDENGTPETIDEAGLIWSVETVAPENRVQNFYSLYDANGVLYGEILLEKHFSTVRIGKYTFDGVRSALIVCGAGNAMYLLLTYGDSASLYTVTFN